MYIPKTACRRVAVTPPPPASRRSGGGGATAYMPEKLLSGMRERKAAERESERGAEEGVDAKRVSCC